MKIREMLEREKYIDNTIDEFAKRTRYMEAQIGWDNPSINISVNNARHIATCLEWLHEIFKQNIDSINIRDVSIENLPDNYY